MMYLVGGFIFGVLIGLCIQSLFLPYNWEDYDFEIYLVPAVIRKNGGDSSDEA